jgi:hypothetical protein
MQRQRDKDPRTPSARPRKLDDTPAAPLQTRRDPGTLSVRLTRKYAEMIDGVNLSHAHVGDRLDLPAHDAEMLIAEGWAVFSPRRSATHAPQRALAADTGRKRKKTAKR